MWTLGSRGSSRKRRCSGCRLAPCSNAGEATEKLHREKLATEREGENEEETADPMAAAEAQAVKQSS